MKYFVGGALVVLAVGAGAVAWTSIDTDSAEPGTVVVTIRYTDDGYDPKEVSIKKGEAVRFVNESSVEMWPASAVHPTHSLYPESSDADCLGSSFDSCERIPPGGTWEFTFRVEGDWKFHDHVRSSRTGIVHVK